MRTGRQTKTPTCPCGDGSAHSLRTAGLCDGLRSTRVGEADKAKIRTELDRLNGRTPRQEGKA